MATDTPGRLTVEEGLGHHQHHAGGKVPAAKERRTLLSGSASYMKHSELSERLILQQSRHSVLVSAWHGPTSQQVVVKAYQKAALKPRQMQNVYREIALLSLLRDRGCTGVVQLLSAFDEESQLYLVFEACLRGDLYQLLMREPDRQLSEQLVASSVALPLAMTLAELHGMQIVHRDLKPENVFINTEGHVMLGDFGLGARFSDNLTERVGTLDYMAPEVLAMPTPGEVEAGRGVPAVPYSEKVDVWALGCLCFELLAGKPPFEVADPKETAALILAGKAAPLPERLSPACCDFIRSALAHSPKQRPSAAQLLQHPWIARYVPAQQLRNACSRAQCTAAMAAEPVAEGGNIHQHDGAASCHITPSSGKGVECTPTKADACRDQDDSPDWMIGTELLTVHQQQQLRAQQAAANATGHLAPPATPASSHAPATPSQPRSMQAQQHAAGTASPTAAIVSGAARSLMGSFEPCMEGSGAQSSPGDKSCQAMNSSSSPASISPCSSSSSDTCPLEGSTSPTGMRGAMVRRASSGTSEYIAYSTPRGSTTPAAQASCTGAEDDAQPDSVMARSSSVALLSEPVHQQDPTMHVVPDARVLRPTSSCNGALEGHASAPGADGERGNLVAWQAPTPSSAAKRAVGKSRFAR